MSTFVLFREIKWAGKKGHKQREVIYTEIYDSKDTLYVYNIPNEDGPKSPYTF